MPAAKKFGTFGGVFTPSILTILGVIMYLRLPSIVGQGGLLTALGIIVVAHVISVATGLSVASIATDKKVQAGGTYYMLSRSIGLPIGGTLGLALFVGLSFSVSLYVIGFSESFLSYWDWGVTKNSIRIAGSITLLVVTTVTLISTALALKTQFFIMAAIGLSLLSIIFGNHDLGPAETVATSLPTAVPFIVLFGIFFPAVTGFEAGVSMSGDLKDPKKSIPAGTISAIVVGLVVYLALAWFLASTVSVEQLATNPTVLLDISFFAPAVVAGIWGATISSALGSILGAPRILQATAVDRIVPRFFAKGYGKENEPRHALIMTFIIAEAGILIGELDVIARIVSMFFITTYGFLNLSCFIESWASPDFRPEFKIPKFVSLIGTTACFIVMIQLDFVAMIGATVLLGLVFLYLKRKELTLETGDTWEGFWSSLLRSGLQRLSQSSVHERNWRPNVLLFSFGTHARDHLMSFGGWLVHKRGLLSNFDLDVNPQSKQLQRHSAQATSDEEEVESGIFTRRLSCPDAYEAMASLATYYGFSGVEPNTVVMGWAGNNRHSDRFLQLLQRYDELDLNVLLVKIDKQRAFGERKTIDVWWRGEDNNISLTLALIRFLTAADSWMGASIRFLVVNEGDTAYSGAIQSRMDGILETFRITARAVVINNVVGRKPVEEIIGYESAKTDLTIMGMPPITSRNAATYIEETGRMLDRIGTALLVDASSFFETLSVGIETSARVQTEAATDFVEVDERAALSMPDDESLRWALQRFDGGLQEITDELADGSLASVADMPAQMGREIRDTVKRALASLGRSLEKEDRPRARRTNQRTQAVLSHRSQEIVSSYMAEQLPLQNKVIEAAVAKVRSDLANLIRQTPEELKRAREKPVAENPDESASEESLIRRIFSRSESISVPFRDLVEIRGNEDYHRLIHLAIESTCGAMHELTESILVQLRNSFDALQRIASDVETDSLDADSIPGELQRLEGGFDDLFATYRDRQAAVRKGLRVGTRKLVQNVVDEVGTITRKPPRLGAEQGRLAALLAEAPIRCEENQGLLLSRTTLGLQLISFQQRLRTIVQRYREELALAIQNILIKPLREIEKVVDALSSEDQAEAESRIRTAEVIPATFDATLLYEDFAAAVRTAVEETPESIRTLPEHAVQSVVAHPLVDVDVITLSLRRVIDYTVKMELLGPLQQELSLWPARAQRSHAASQDILRLLNFQTDESVGDDVDVLPDTQKAILDKSAERLRMLLESLTEETEALNQMIASRLEIVLERLNPYTLTRTEGDLQRYVRGHTGRQLQSRIQAVRQRTQGYVRDRLVNLLYQRSEGVLLARQLQEADPYLGSAALKGLRLVESVSPSDAVLKDLPMYYRQLFLDLPNITDEFWVGAEEQLKSANQAVERWKGGRTGGLLVLGESNSGKTALCQLVAQKNFKRDAIFQVNTLRGGSIDVVVFHKKLREALGVTGAPDKWAAQLPPQCVVIVNDAERWWERSRDGMKVLIDLEALIERLGRRCLFLVNANVHSLKLIDRIHPFTRNFLDIITRAPSNAEQIKKVVTLRHRSAGLNFILDGQPEDAVSEWKQARFFTRLFDYSRGNVGTALQGWIAGIRRVSNDGLVIEALEPPDLSILDSAPSLQKGILVHVLLHGSVTLDRLLVTSEIDEAQLMHEVQLLQRLGWIRDADGVLSIDRFLRPHLTQALVERRLIG